MRPRFDSAVQSSIEFEDWNKIRARLKSDKEAKRSHKIYKSQMSALHLACQRDPPTDIVSHLIKANPKAASSPSQPYGEIPLHFALGKRLASIEVIRLLVEIYPDGISTENTMGTTPLHIACTFAAPYEIIKLLCDSCPRAVFIEDNNGRTPWDIAKVQYTIFNPWNWFMLKTLRGGAYKKETGDFQDLED